MLRHMSRHHAIESRAYSQTFDPYFSKYTEQRRCSQQSSRQPIETETAATTACRSRSGKQESRKEVLEKMGIKSGCNLETGLRLLDEQQVKEAEKVAQASTKEGRIAARNRKRQRDEEEALAEDILSPFTINLEQIAPVVKEKSVPK
ncbi:hypothetical protein NQ318_022146 [Aromia moschata]|uniref:Uncharacterized protein n=1 Tax=Aromia moschata TaxID=1265417 RepID=A0AAV8Z867_9CUCU|nr:hypothetical protein NQ318_022146 [Aromia moschata]